MALLAPPPHFAMLASAGMGHLQPCLRVAAILSSRNCNVTLITARPTVSDSESSHISAFLSSYPKINHLAYHPQPLLDDDAPGIEDPFFRQFEAIRRSIHLVTPLLRSVSPTALVVDISISASVARVVLPELKTKLPSYVLSVTSAKFFSLICYLPVLLSEADVTVENEKKPMIVEIPGVDPIDKCSLPPPFTIPDSSFVAELIDNGASFPTYDAILVNTFTHFERRTLEALNGGRVMQGLPPVLPIGPLPDARYKLKQVNQETRCMILQWLDSQPERSVVYLAFGSRNALPKDQIAEISKALEQCKYRFLWTVKLTIVDKEDNEELVDVLGQAFFDNVKNRGLVIREWVDQDMILSHSATGAFVSHCGWNSLTEAAERGVPVLGWPRGGDQKVNAEVAVEGGLAVWDRGWSKKLVEANEIVRKLEEVMDGVEFRKSAEMVGEEAMRAVGDGGSSEATLKQVIGGTVAARH